MPLIRAKYGPEIVIDGGLEAWTNNTPDEWTEEGESAGVRDITKETTEIHGGAAAAKLQATNSDGSTFLIRATQNVLVNSYYLFTGWAYYPTRSLGISYFILFPTSKDTIYIGLPPGGSWVRYVKVFQTTEIGITIKCAMYSETTSGIIYFDDISLRLLYPRVLGR